MSAERATSGMACYAILRRDNQAYFLLRQNTGYHDGEHSLPAGRVEAGETYLEGAAREANEEAGVTVNVSRLRHVHTACRTSENGTRLTDVYFETNGWDGKPHNASPGEHAEGVWFALDDLPESVMPYQRETLGVITLGGTYSEYAD